MSYILKSIKEKKKDDFFKHRQNIFLKCGWRNILQNDCVLMPLILVASHFA